MRCIKEIARVNEIAQLASATNLRRSQISKIEKVKQQKSGKTLPNGKTKKKSKIFLLENRLTDTRNRLSYLRSQIYQLELENIFFRKILISNNNYEDYSVLKESMFKESISGTNTKEKHSTKNETAARPQKYKRLELAYLLNA